MEMVQSQVDFVLFYILNFLTTGGGGTKTNNQKKKTIKKTKTKKKKTNKTKQNKYHILLVQFQKHSDHKVD